MKTKTKNTNLNSKEAFDIFGLIFLTIILTGVFSSILLIIFKFILENPLVCFWVIIIISFIGGFISSYDITFNKESKLRKDNLSNNK